MLVFRSETGFEVDFFLTFQHAISGACRNSRFKVVFKIVFKVARERVRVGQRMIGVSVPKAPTPPPSWRAGRTLVATLVSYLP